MRHCRDDVEAWLHLVAHGEVATSVVSYSQDAANAALADLRVGRTAGAAILVPGLGDRYQPMPKRRVSQDLTSRVRPP